MCWTFFCFAVAVFFCLFVFTVCFLYHFNCECLSTTHVEFIQWIRHHPHNVYFLFFLCDAAIYLLKCYSNVWTLVWFLYETTVWPWFVTAQEAPILFIQRIFNFKVEPADGRCFIWVDLPLPLSTAEQQPSCWNIMIPPLRGWWWLCNLLNLIITVWVPALLLCPYLLQTSGCFNPSSSTSRDESGAEVWMFFRVQIANKRALDWSIICILWMKWLPEQVCYSRDYGSFLQKRSTGVSRCSVVNEEELTNPSQNKIGND